MAIDEFTKKRYFKALYGCMDNMTNECGSDQEQKACKVCPYGKAILEIQSKMTDEEYLKYIQEFTLEVIKG